MNNKDLLYTNSFNTNSFDKINNIFNKKQYNFNTDEIQRENKKLDKTIPDNIYKKVEKEFITIKNQNDLIETNNYNNLYKNTPESNNKPRIVIKKTNISIYSEDRNLEKNILPNNFEIELNKTYKNVSKLVLKDIYFPNSIPLLNENNDIFQWQYPSLIESDDIFIPQNKTDDNYSFILPDDFDWSKILTIDNNYKYSAKLNIKYSSVNEFSKLFNQEISKEFYLNYNENNDECINSEYIHDKVFQNILFNNDTRDRIYTKGIEFDIDINKNTHVVKMVNRVNKIPIYAIQTFKHVHDGIYDIFKNYSINKQLVDGLIEDAIYILVKRVDMEYIYDTSVISPEYDASGRSIFFTDNSFNNLSYDIFPLVLTGMPDVGNLKKEHINYTPFYNIHMYEYSTENQTNINKLNFSYPDISNYRYIDEIVFTDICGNENRFLRLQLILNRSNINGLHFDKYIRGFDNKSTMGSNITTTIITNEWLRNYMRNIDILGNTSSAIDYFTQEEVDKIPIIGKALPLHLIKKTNISNKNKSRNKIESVLDILGWTNQHVTKNGQNVSLKEKYYFIHSNIDGFYKTIFSRLDSLQLNPEKLFKYLSPQRKLNLELINGEYYFKSIPFIYIKIIPNQENIVIQDKLIRVFDDKNIINNLEYKKNIWNVLDNMGNEYYEPNTENILAKIYLESVPFKTTILTDINKEYTFFDKSLKNLNKFNIIITDPYGRMLDIGNDYSMTIEIHEIINVL